LNTAVMSQLVGYIEACRQSIQREARARAPCASPAPRVVHAPQICCHVRFWRTALARCARTVGGTARRASPPPGRRAVRTAAARGLCGRAKRSRCGPLLAAAGGLRPPGARVVAAVKVQPLPRTAGEALRANRQFNLGLLCSKLPPGYDEARSGSPLQVVPPLPVHPPGSVPGDAPAGAPRSSWRSTASAWARCPRTRLMKHTACWCKQ